MSLGLSQRARAGLLLLGTVIVWGASFVVVKSALADASPLLFNLLRMLLASAILFAVNRRALRKITRPQLLAGAAAGLFLGIGYQFQTLGLLRTSAAKSALITGLVVVLVPVLGSLPALRVPGARGNPWLTGAGSATAFCGLALLTTPAGTRWTQTFTAAEPGDLLTAVCALGFALHLLTLAHISTRIPPGVLASVQIAAAAVLMLLTLPLQSPHVQWTPRLIAALAVTGILSTAAAFTVQSYAQRHLHATETAVLLTLEPVFATGTAMLLLGEQLSTRTLAGAVLILGSIVLIEFAPGLLRAREIPA